MKFEDRIQLKLSDLTEELFEKIVAYGFCAPSGMGGPGCVIMIAEDGRSYQFYGPELSNLNYYREWAFLFPVLNQCDTRQWKLAENVSCAKLLVRNDIYELFMENLPTPEKMIYYCWEDSCIKATLLLHAKTEDEIEKINWRYELRTPLFEKDDLVEFYFDNGKKKTKCKGVIAGTDIYRIQGKIETIEYDIWGKDYETYRKKCLYKHIDENHIKATPGKLLILSGFSGVGKGTVIQQLLTEYPEKYVVSVSATTRKPRKGEVDGEYYGTLKKDVYKNYFKGKNVIIEIDSQGARQIREKQKIQSVFLIPPSFEELLHRLKNRGTESKESIHRRLKQALDEIEHIEEYGVLLVNDSVEGTAFVIDALFHPVLKNASGMNERELKIVREIREGIIKYLSDEASHMV